MVKSENEVIVGGRLRNRTGIKIRPKSYTKRMFGFLKADEKLVDRIIRDYERETERRYFGEEEIGGL
jgi:hypothetical protein